MQDIKAYEGLEVQSLSF